MIDHVLMEAMGVDADSPLEISFKGNSLEGTPVHVGIGRERVAKELDELRGSHPPA